MTWYFGWHRKDGWKVFESEDVPKPQYDILYDCVYGGWDTANDAAVEMNKACAPALSRWWKDNPDALVFKRKALDIVNHRTTVQQLIEDGLCGKTRNITDGNGIVIGSIKVELSSDAWIEEQKEMKNV